MTWGRLSSFRRRSCSPVERDFLGRLDGFEVQKVQRSCSSAVEVGDGFASLLLANQRFVRPVLCARALHEHAQPAANRHRFEFR